MKLPPTMIRLSGLRSRFASSMECPIHGVNRFSRDGAVMMMMGGAGGQEGDKDDGRDVPLSRGCSDEPASFTVQNQVYTQYRD